MTIREAIQRAIDEDDISEAELAEKAGVGHAGINRYLRGIRDLRGVSLDKLIEFLDLEVTREGWD
jgi:transcriptional regulator with XRE-family HTH domain